eukprot:SAG31_NODE_3517_length_4167_cov_1.945428_2_plen_492_part_00
MCPNLAAGGAKCEDCVIDNERALMGAGCFPKHERHGLIEAFCYPDDPTLRVAIVAMQQELQEADGTHLSQRTDGHPTITAMDSSFLIYNCTFFGADGTTFSYFGVNGHFENNLFESNDWTCHDDDEHSGMGCVLLGAAGGHSDVFTQNTMIGNGPSVMYACGANATMTLNHCLGQADIDNDGVCLQIRSSSAKGTTMAFNWAERSAKGLRLDSGSNNAFCSDEVDNTIHANVALLTHGMELKNDYNRITDNLVLWSEPEWLIRSGASQQQQVLRIDTGRFKGENSHSIVQGNIASSWSTPVPGITSVYHPNILSSTVGLQMRDPANLDMRPRLGTPLAQSGIGPYGSNMSKLLGAASTVLSDSGVCAMEQHGGGSGSYWIPGRRGWRAGSPVPPSGTADAAPDLDLMFLPSVQAALSRTTSHVVLFGTSVEMMRPVGPALSRGCNVQSLPHSPLPLNSTWFWRVDEVETQSGAIVHGEVWHFRVRTKGAAL